LSIIKDLQEKLLLSNHYGGYGNTVCNPAPPGTRIELVWIQDVNLGIKPHAQRKLGTAVRK
jgi:hypothetical protein